MPLCHSSSSTPNRPRHSAPHACNSSTARSSRRSRDDSPPPLPPPSQAPGSQHSHDGRSCPQRPNCLPKLLRALFLAALPRGLVRFAALAPRLAARRQQLLVLVLLQQLVDCTPEAREVRQRCGHL